MHLNSFIKDMVFASVPLGKLMTPCDFRADEKQKLWKDVRFYGVKIVELSRSLPEKCLADMGW